MSFNHAALPLQVGANAPSPGVEAPDGRGKAVQHAPSRNCRPPVPYFFAGVSGQPVEHGGNRDNAALEIL